MADVAQVVLATLLGVAAIVAAVGFVNRGVSPQRLAWNDPLVKSLLASVVDLRGRVERLEQAADPGVSGG